MSPTRSYDLITTYLLSERDGTKTGGKRDLDRGTESPIPHR